MGHVVAAPAVATHCKVLALSCLVVEPVVHGFAGPTAGATCVAIGLVGYAIGLVAAAWSQTGIARAFARLSLLIGGPYLGGWMWVRFGPVLDAAPWFLSPWLGQMAVGVEIAALAFAADRRAWVSVLMGMWVLGLPLLQRQIFLLAPQVAVLWPSLMAVAAMVVLGQAGRRQNGA